MTTDTTLIQRIKDLTARFGKGWHDGIQIDASDIADLCLAADALEQQAAQIAEKDAEIARLKTVMIAAAEEIGAHWDAHCDAEGYGPVNLLRRLEQGIPSEYGYTAGAFARMKAEVEALRADAETYRAALNVIAERQNSDWPDRCQALVNTARAALRQEQPTPLVEIGRRTTPCGECHLQPGECCDICGARDVSGQPAGEGEK